MPIYRIRDRSGEARVIIATKHFAQHNIAVLGQYPVINGSNGNGYASIIDIETDRQITSACLSDMNNNGLWVYEHRSSSYLKYLKPEDVDV